MPREDAITLNLGLPELRVLAQSERHDEMHIRVEAEVDLRWIESRVQREEVVHELV